MDWPRLNVLLDHVKLKGGEQPKEAEEWIIVQDLPEAVKLAYVRAIVWMVYDDDSQIDVRELAELQLLMTQLRFSPQLRRETRLAIEEAGGVELESVLDEMFEQVPAGSRRPLSISLVKDMMRVFQAANGDDRTDSPQITRVCELLGVEEEQREVVSESLQFDRQLLDRSLAPGEMKKAAEALATKAASVGVPIAAVYLSGSVTGLSAAGITSGLGALGVGGVLGLSSMVTGVGVVVLLGVGVYKGAQWMMSGKEQQRREQLRELMLQEVIRNHQKTIAALGEDLAFIAKRVVGLTKDVGENKLRIERLGKEVTLFTSAMEALVARGDGYEDALQVEMEQRTGKRETGAG